MPLVAAAVQTRLSGTTTASCPHAETLRFPRKRASASAGVHGNSTDDPLPIPEDREAGEPWDVVQRRLHTSLAPLAAEYQQSRD